VIALGSMRGISQESRAGAMARLAAWNKHMTHKSQRYQRQGHVVATIRDLPPRRRLAAISRSDGGRRFAGTLP